MKVRNMKEIAKIFREFADKIENGTCGTDLDTLQEIANNMIHIKLNVEEMCKFINTSRPTLFRMVNDRRLPRPHKDAGGKEYWYRDEVEDHIADSKK